MLPFFFVLSIEYGLSEVLNMVWFGFQLMVHGTDFVVEIEVLSWQIEVEIFN